MVEWILNNMGPLTRKLTLLVLFAQLSGPGCVQLDGFNPTSVRCQANWKPCMFVHKGGTAGAFMWGFSSEQKSEEWGVRSEERGISWLSVFWTLSYWTDVDVSDGRPSQTRGYGSEPTHLLLFEVLDQSHLCTACWYNSESKAWLAAVIKLSKKKKRERSTAGFFIGTEQTITQLDSKQCRWDTTKVYKSSHTLGCTPPASSIKVSENRLDTQTDTKKP